MKLHIALAAVLVTAALALTAAPPALAGRRPISLSAEQKREIIHAPHPYLAETCLRGVDVLVARRAKAGAGRVIVAMADCRAATSGTPLETAVYARRDGALTQLYRLDAGRPIRRAHVSIEAISFRVRGDRAVVRYGGYEQGDPLCCASRSYHLVFRLHRNGFTRGALVRDR
jgi:hypothetical protein